MSPTNALYEPGQFRKYGGCSRLIPKTFSHSIEEGVKAKIKDPLWFLSRQWQMEEFRARNGGNLVRTEVTVKTQEVDQIQINKDLGFQPLSSSEIPLEPLIENEIIEGSQDTITPLAWNPQQLEYKFSIKAFDSILESSEYYGDNLDWYDFQIRSAIGSTGNSQFYSLNPQRVSFQGMPNARWWKFEDGITDLGDIQRPNLNFLSMLLIEFALIYSNDWFVIPLKQKVGSLRKVEDLTVIDTFGIFDQIRPIVDTTSDEHLWTMYTLSGNEDFPSAGSSLFFLPNVVAHSSQSEPIEHISISRDELANLIWAIEKKYFSAENGVVNREDEIMNQNDDQPSIDQYPIHRLKSNLPSNWIPYLPMQKSCKGDTILRRGRTDENASTINPQYKGQILKESIKICEEEIPSLTLDLTRKYKLIAYGPEEWGLNQVGESWELIKTKEKKLLLWIGRNKKPGNRQGSSGLRFDYLIEK